MWSVDEMDKICQELRAETEKRGSEAHRRVVDEELIKHIEAETEEYREWYAKHRASEPIENAVEPPEELRERLWLIGWMIYEASWQLLTATRPA